MSLPTIVLVHGSWHSPEHFGPLINNLQSHGYKCVPVALPSTQSPDLPPSTLGDDTTAIRDTVDFCEGQANDGWYYEHKVKTGSLRMAVNTILGAQDDESLTEGFGGYAAERYTELLSLPRGRGHDCAKMITAELKALVGKACTAINRYFPPQDDYYHYHEYWSRAKADSMADYFTFLPVDGREMPWAKEKEWVELEFDKPVAASEAWLKAVGLK
ncbi:hypothetical protein LTR09_010522 [Extremus antarcticus]|uniref:AB hydrolase-1 domain-containing protein n=1 Tax=Extremus antarcticus TaxID=702011 RepID=A0AAJ0G8D7_9PEZI|nr:hypothetical protein LTR09_010522 [Extremus antarcticus]